MDDNDTLQALAVDQQPAGHTACIADGALLRDPLFTCVHIVMYNRLVVKPVSSLDITPNDLWHQLATHKRPTKNLLNAKLNLLTTYPTLTMQLSVLLD